MLGDTHVFMVQQVGGQYRAVARDLAGVEALGDTVEEALELAVDQFLIAVDDPEWEQRLDEPEGEPHMVTVPRSSTG